MFQVTLTPITSNNSILEFLPETFVYFTFILHSVLIALHKVYINKNILTHVSIMVKKNIYKTHRPSVLFE